MSEARKIVILPGDGIGPEIVAEGRRVLEHVNARHDLGLALEERVFGGAAWDECGDPLPPATLEACRSAAAILLGAIGGPRFDAAPRDLRPERGLLRRRRALGRGAPTSARRSSTPSSRAPRRSGPSSSRGST